MSNLKSGRPPHPKPSLDIPTLVCLSTTPRCSCPFCAHDPQEPLRPQSLTLGGLKRILGPRSPLTGRSSTLILSRPELTRQGELIAIVTYAERRFEKIRLHTDGALLAEADRLNELISAGVSCFASPLYGPRRVHNFLTHPGAYDRTLSYMTNLVQALRGLPHLKLEIQLFLTPENGEHTPALVEQLLSRFGDAVTYSVSGPTAPAARGAHHRAGLSAIRSHITRTLELLLDAHVSLQLSALPLCEIERALRAELLPRIRQQTNRQCGCFYYLAPGQPDVQLRLPRSSRSRACLGCPFQEVCAKCMASSVAHVQENTEPASHVLH